MNPVITDLIIKRFRSIPSAQITFDNPTFLVGRNGAGKSNLVDVFAFLAEAMASPLQAVFDTRGGIAAVRNRTSGRSYPPHLGLGVLFGALNGQSTRGRYAFEVKALPNYGFEVLREQCRVLGPDGNTNWFDRSARRFKTNVKGLEPSLDPASLGLPVVGGDARFAPILRTLAGMRVYSIEPAEVQEMQDPDSGVSLRTDGSNAASVLQEIERRSGQDMEQICEALGTIVPNTTRVHTKKHGKKISLEFVQEWGGNKRLRFEAFNMSDGTLRALGLLTAVYQHPSPSLLAIEEPEATIHPGALGAVLDLLRHASRNQQVVVTTHSPEVLDAEWLQHNHLRIVNWHEGATRITGVPEGARQAMQEHLMGAGDLFRCNALEPEPALFRACRL
ncbi:MAG: AAA family ATPase, partial [Planctomycetes bacterium]|nr:AAA family ATPase [Planctomycetota bacterium]